MVDKEKLEKIRKEIALCEVEKALSLLEDLLGNSDEVLFLKARFKDIEQNKVLGIHEKKDFNFFLIALISFTTLIDKDSPEMKFVELSKKKIIRDSVLMSDDIEKYEKNLVKLEVTRLISTAKKIIEKEPWDTTKKIRWVLKQIEEKNNSIDIYDLILKLSREISYWNEKQYSPSKMITWTLLFFSIILLLILFFM